MKITPSLSAAALAVLLLGSACKQSVADLPARDHSRDGSVVPVSLPVTTATAKTDPRDQPIPQVSGKPMWAANRNHTAEDNAQYQFTNHGQDFGAATVAAYVAKAHDFTGHPPARAETFKRANGDTLIYDAKDNIFAVVSKEGAPRTMFKPPSGAAYWAQQKDAEAGKSSKDGEEKTASKRSPRKTSSQG